jgi:hypothetical protein
MMKTYLASGFAAAVIASATFAGSASAQSTQYEPYAESPPSIDDSSVDTTTTGSIYPDNQFMTGSGNMADTGVDGSQDTGDYYEGVSRPTN